MKLTGGCHCGAMHFELTWPDGETELPARRCTCSYCLRFDGTWTSHPDAELLITGGAAALGSAYRFGTGTADFLFCSGCGVTVAAVCETEGALRAVVNINTLHSCELPLARSDSDFDAENLDERLNRRAGRWIGKVTLA
jgi:hypothetical protein